MYSHYRLEPDQTDSVVVCATRQEWRQLMEDIWDEAHDLSPFDKIYEVLRSQGVFD